MFKLVGGRPFFGSSSRRHLNNLRVAKLVAYVLIIQFVVVLDHSVVCLNVLIHGLICSPKWLINLIRIIVGIYLMQLI